MARATPYVTSCCCGCSLKTGCLIIGWLEIITSLLAISGLVVQGLALPYVSEAAESIRQFHPQLADNTVKMAYIILVFASAIIAVSFIAGCFLVAGINQMKAGHCKVWIYLMVLNVLLNVALSIATAVIVGHQAINFIGQTIGQAVSILLLIYFILVVKSAIISMENNLPIEHVQTIVVMHQIQEQPGAQPPPAYAAPGQQPEAAAILSKDAGEKI